MRRLLLAAVVAASCFSIGRVASAAGVFLSAERFGYTGTWDRYDTLADAQGGINVTESGGLPQRDLAIYVSQGIPDNPFDPEFDILTRWYGPDVGNPNNTNEGFFQYYDDDATTVTSLDAYWNESLTAFTFTAQASDADYASDFARFGERAGGPGTATEAFFHSLDIGLTISGLTGSYNAITGRYEGFDTAAASISGLISGIVENVGTDLSRNGFYVFNLNLNDTSWAYDNGHVVDGQLEAFSTNAVPEPASATLFLGGLACTGLFSRRRKSA